MKASLKFRDDQKPLFRAKVPLNILGFPFQSGIVAGESKDLSLNLGTFFESGPSLKMAYRPNDSLNPFSLVFKTGIGHFGSPISSSMTMSAEFNPIGNQNPSFFVHFKPQFGDFTIKKSQSSSFVKIAKPKENGVVSDENGSLEVVETPLVNSGYLLENGLVTGEKITVLPPESPAAGLVKSVFSGMEVSARTAIPLSNRVVANFRWGVRLPTEEEAAAKSNPAAGISFQKFPLLMMNKIGIEHVAGDDSKSSGEVARGSNSPEEACLDVKRQLEVIQAENGMLRKAMEDLRSEIGSVKLASSSGAVERARMNKIDRRSNGDNNKKSSALNDFGGEGHSV